MTKKSKLKKSSSLMQALKEIQKHIISMTLFNDFFLKGDQTYTSVPELHIFYISQTDIRSLDKTYYRVKKFLEDLDTPYDDGLHMYYINAEINDNSAIAQLMQYFKTAKADDFSQGSLSKRINYLKETKEGLTTMDEFSKKLYDAGINDGRAEGETKEKFATVKRMLALGKSLQDIALSTDLPLAKVQELQAEM